MTKGEAWTCVLALGGFIMLFVMIISFGNAENYEKRMPIPNTNCEVVEYHDRNLWFTPGETTVDRKVVCTVDKVAVGQ